MAENNGSAAAAADKKAAIYEMQYYLKFISKHVSGISEVTPDGIYGKKTEAAVMEFQNKYSLDPTGEINRATWNKITSVYEALEEEHTAAEPLHVYPIDLSSMKKDDDYGEILLLQGVLKKLSDRYENLLPVTSTGIYDAETENIVRQLQEIFSLPQTGIVNKATWNRIAKFYSGFTFND